MIRNALEQGAQEMGLVISEGNIQAFELFAAELKKWNRKINLTAITSDNEIAVKHIIDSLIFAGYVRDGERVLDIGSGAGVPAIPLKVIKPSVWVTSVDAVGKKILFQKHMGRLLELEGFEAIHTRAEGLQSTHARGFDLVTSRAFSRLEQFVALAAPLLANGGRMIAMKGPSVASEIVSNENQLRALGFEIIFINHYCLPFGMGERSLVGVAPLKTA